MWTIKLLRFNQVPSDFHEPFIIDGYRSCRSSIKSCIISAIQGTNETVNFWTHFLPAIGFAWIMLQRVVALESFGDTYEWPILCFLLATCLYMLASALAHLFNCMSLPARYVTFFFDYGAISMYSLGVCVVYNAYIFPPELLNSWLYHIYLPIGMFMSAACTILACYSRLASSQLLRQSGRLPAFMLPYIWCSIPLVYRVLFCPEVESDANPDALFYHVRQFLCVTVTALFYATRFPEVLSPGTFDILGHSHQLFHISSSFTSYVQYCALSIDIQERRDFLNDAVGLPTFASTLGTYFGLLVLNLLIIWGFSSWVSQPHALDEIKRKHGLEDEPCWSGHGFKCD